MDFFIVPVIFGLIVAVALAAAAGSRRYESQWRAAAERLQLGLQPGRLFSRPKISGTVGDLTVAIDVSSSSSGSSGSVRTRYRVGYPSLGFDLRMSRQTGLAKAAAMLGMSDARIGDSAFDEAFSIRTSDPQRLSMRLSADTRRVLLDLVDEYRSVRITDEQLSYEKNGIDRDTGTLVTTARRLIEGARALQGASAEPVRRAPLPVREPIPPPPPVLSPDPFEIQPALHPTPSRPVVGRESEPKEPAPEPPDHTSSGISAEEVAGILFSKKGLSFQIARSFEEKYQGSSIDWPGTVREMVGGIGPRDPIRVTVLVATVRHELFGSVDVEAVASITGRAPRGLAVGQQVRMQGMLSAIDAMARRLFVEDARLA